MASQRPTPREDPRFAALSDEEFDGVMKLNAHMLIRIANITVPQQMRMIQKDASYISYISNPDPEVVRLAMLQKPKADTPTSWSEDIRELAIRTWPGSAVGMPELAPRLIELAIELNEKLVIFLRMPPDMQLKYAKTILKHDPKRATGPSTLGGFEHFGKKHGGEMLLSAVCENLSFDEYLRECQDLPCLMHAHEIMCKTPEQFDRLFDEFAHDLHSRSDALLKSKHAKARHWKSIFDAILRIDMKRDKQWIEYALCRDKNSELDVLAIQVDPHNMSAIRSYSDNFIRVALELKIRGAVELFAHRVNDFMNLLAYEPAAYKHLKHKTPEITRVVLMKDGMCLAHVQQQTDEFCRIAITQTPNAYDAVKCKTTELKHFFYATHHKFIMTRGGPLLIADKELLDIMIEKCDDVNELFDFISRRGETRSLEVSQVVRMMHRGLKDHRVKYLDVHVMDRVYYEVFVISHQGVLTDESLRRIIDACPKNLSQFLLSRRHQNLICDTAPEVFIYVSNPIEDIFRRAMEARVVHTGARFHELPESFQWIVVNTNIEIADRLTNPTERIIEAIIVRDIKVALRMPVKWKLMARHARAYLEKEPSLWEEPLLGGEDGQSGKKLMEVACNRMSFIEYERLCQMSPQFLHGCDFVEMTSAEFSSFFEANWDRPDVSGELLRSQRLLPEHWIRVLHRMRDNCMAGGDTFHGYDIYGFCECKTSELNRMVESLGDIQRHGDSREFLLYLCNLDFHYVIRKAPRMLTVELFETFIGQCADGDYVFRCIYNQKRLRTLTARHVKILLMRGMLYTGLYALSTELLHELHDIYSPARPTIANVLEDRGIIIERDEHDISDSESLNETFSRSSSVGVDHVGVWW